MDLNRLGMVGLLSSVFVSAGCGHTSGSGWRSLFDGEDLSAWQIKPDGWVIEDGAMFCRPKGGYAWTTERFADFVLDLEFKLAQDTNSGIFLRTDKLSDPVQTGIEIQILDSHGRQQVGRHDCGAVYDCLAPAVNAVKPPGEWNRVIVTCDGPRITVILNDVPVIDMDLDDWTDAGLNPDGSKNKFKTAFKDMPREGFIGIQDHGKPVWIRKVRIRPLS